MNDSFGPIFYIKGSWKILDVISDAFSLISAKLSDNFPFKS